MSKKAINIMMYGDSTGTISRGDIPLYLELTGSKLYINPANAQLNKM